MSDRQQLPPGVTATRMIAFVQGALGMLTGAFVLFGAGAVAASYGVSGGAAVAGVALIGVLLLVVSGLLFWGGIMLGNLSPRARVLVLVYEWLAIALGLVQLANLGLGIISLLLAGVAVYYLQFDAQTKAAFSRGTRPGSTVG